MPIVMVVSLLAAVAWSHTAHRRRRESPAVEPERHRTPVG
jgi:hypothetical protein